MSPSYPPQNSFIPNFLLDFAKGDAYFCGGKVVLKGSDDSVGISITTPASGIISLNKNGLQVETSAGNAFKVTEADGLSYNIRGTDTGLQGKTLLDLNRDGSGSLADGKFEWKADGSG